MKRFLDGYCKFVDSIWFGSVLLIMCLVFLILGFLGYLEGFNGQSVLFGLGLGLYFPNFFESAFNKIKQKKNRQTKTQ